MRLLRFTVTIEEFVDDLDAVDAFYARADDVSLESSEGRTLIHFDRSAPSLDHALRSAAADIQAQGWRIDAIAVEPDCVVPAATI